MIRSRVSVFVCCALALALYGCGDDSTDSPTSPTPPAVTTPPTTPITPPTTPTPIPPTPTTFAVSGFVSEAAPTADVRVEGARVSLTGDIATTTNARGEFRFSSVPAGSYELRASRDGYVDQVRTVTVGSDASVNFDLLPVEGVVEQRSSGRLGQDDAICSGSSKPCRNFQFAVHYDGPITADLTWVSSDADMDLELRCNSQVVAVASGPNNGVQERIESQVLKGQRCELRVLHISGPVQEFTLNRTHPN